MGLKRKMDAKDYNDYQTYKALARGDADKNAILDQIIIYSPHNDNSPNYIDTEGSSSPYNPDEPNVTPVKELVIEDEYTTIYLYFSKVKINGDFITVTLIDENDIEFPFQSFEVPK